MDELPTPQAGAFEELQGVVAERSRLATARLRSLERFIQSAPSVPWQLAATERTARSLRALAGRLDRLRPPPGYRVGSSGRSAAEEWAATTSPEVERLRQAAADLDGSLVRTAQLAVIDTPSVVAARRRVIEDAGYRPEDAYATWLPDLPLVERCGFAFEGPGEQNFAGRQLTRSSIDQPHRAFLATWAAEEPSPAMLAARAYLDIVRVGSFEPEPNSWDSASMGGSWAGRSWLTETLEAAPEQPFANLLAGWRALRHAKADEAVQRLDVAVAALPRCAAASRLLGLALFQRDGETRRGLGFLRRRGPPAYLHDQQRRFARFHEGLAAYRAGRYRRAARLLDSAWGVGDEPVSDWWLAADRRARGAE